MRCCYVDSVSWLEGEISARKVSVVFVVGGPAWCGYVHEDLDVVGVHGLVERVEETGMAKRRWVFASEVRLKMVDIHGCGLDKEHGQ